MNIQINNLTVKYRKKAVFENFSTELNFDKILIIRGASGKGKTTLMKAIAGFLKYDGEIKMASNQISFMFQEDRLIPFISVLKNVSAVSDEETANKYLTELGLKSELNSSTISLSGGMKRRVAIARALAFNSDLVILDEPFKGLDEELKIKTAELIKKESETRAFIIVSHESEDERLLGASVFNL